ncbi:hypothetical protein ABTX35_01900 [Streptomyces sp. NPDC096080]|uniref:hypothetical protein n=1 Tax=Streptomyces sp. NPDC096080 TaxID=3156693 RepID=UPI00331ED09F
MNCDLCGDEAGDRYLCERDTVILARHLGELPQLHDELVTHLVPSGGGLGAPVTGRGAGPRSPIDEGVLDFIQTARTTEVVHARRVDVQRVRWPQHSAPPPSGLPADCRWLAMELGWIAAEYPAAGEMAREVHALRRELLSLGVEERPARAGLCVAVTDDQGTVCGAVLERLPGRTLRCRWCGTQYRTEQDLMLLAHYQPRASA